MSDGPAVIRPALGGLTDGGGLRGQLLQRRPGLAEPGQLLVDTLHRPPDLRPVVGLLALDAAHELPCLPGLLGPLGRRPGGVEQGRHAEDPEQVVPELELPPARDVAAVGHECEPAENRRVDAELLLEDRQEVGDRHAVEEDLALRPAARRDAALDLEPLPVGELELERNGGLIGIAPDAGDRIDAGGLPEQSPRRRHDDRGLADAVGGHEEGDTLLEGEVEPVVGPPVGQGEPADHAASLTSRPMRSPTSSLAMRPRATSITSLVSSSTS